MNDTVISRLIDALQIVAVALIGAYFARATRNTVAEVAAVQKEDTERAACAIAEGNARRETKLDEVVATSRRNVRNKTPAPRSLD